MALEIKSGGTAPRDRAAKRDNRARSPANDLDAAAPPLSRASVNFIPSPESLATLIDSAVAALRKGVRWDRGTILNLVV